MDIMNEEVKEKIWNENNKILAGAARASMNSPWIGVIFKVSPINSLDMTPIYQSIARYDSEEGAVGGMRRLIEEVRDEAPDCTCLMEGQCDCQKPPPDDWDGISGSWGVSTECPKHNDDPNPNPECLIHGNGG